MRLEVVSVRLLLSRLWLFVRIVWRPWDEDFRIGWRLAWEVSGIIWHR